MTTNEMDPVAASAASSGFLRSMFRSLGDGVSNVYGGMSRGLNNVGSGFSSLATKVYGTLPSMRGTGPDGLVSTMGSTAKSMASDAVSHIWGGSKSALSYVPGLGGLVGEGGTGKVVAVESGT